MKTYIVGESGGMTDLYRTDERYERDLKRIDDWNIQEKDKQSFIRFLRSMQARGIGYVQLLKYIQSMKTFIKFYKKSFSELTKEDLENFLISMQCLMPKTRKIKWYCVKKFFDYIELGNIFFPIHFNINRRQLPEQILTEEEIKKLIETMKTLRNKCLCAILYESGARIGELLMIKRKDIEFDNSGAIIIVYGKTGQRRIRIVEYAEMLKKYIKNLDIDKRLFDFSYMNAAKILRESASEIELKKNVNPHAFRHARATHLSKYLTESQLKEFFGWRQGSYMAQIYVHLSGRDIDEAILKMHGIEPQASEEFEKLKRSGIG